MLVGQERLQQEGRSVNGTGAGAFPWQSCMQSCCCKLGTSQHDKVAVEGSFSSCLSLFRPWVDLAHSVSREGLELALLSTASLWAARAKSCLCSVPPEVELRLLLGIKDQA